MVTKLERSAEEEDVYDCVMDYVALEGARGEERFHLPKQTRKAGEHFKRYHYTIAFTLAHLGQSHVWHHRRDVHRGE